MDVLAVVTLLVALIYLFYRIFTFSQALVNRRRFLEAMRRSSEETDIDERAQDHPRRTLGPRPTTYGVFTPSLIGVGPTPIALFGDSFFDGNMTYEEIIQLQDEIGNVSNGLASDQIQNLPSFVWQDASGECEVEDAKDEKKQICSVCLEQFRNGDVVRVLPCMDRFHASTCVDKWLRLHRTCPVCRYHIS